MGVPSSGVRAYMEMCFAPLPAAISMVFLTSSCVWFLMPSMISAEKFSPLIKEVQ